MEPLTLAIPTGRLFADAVGRLQHLRLIADFPQERSLVLPAADGLQILIAKPADILTFVEQGAADAGIVGKDLLLEQQRDVYELVDLGFGACRGVVALPADKTAQWSRPDVLRIATKYPRVAARFFAAQRMPVEIVELHGSVELAPRVGLADGILDVVMTGQTLRDNLLVEVAEVFRSTARLVVNRVSLHTSGAQVRLLIDRMQAATSPAGRAGAAVSGRESQP